jgi:hypothetical protein
MNKFWQKDHGVFAPTAPSREIDSLLRADSLLNDNSQSSSKSCPILRSSCQRLKNIWVLLDQGTYEQIEEHVEELKKNPYKRRPLADIKKLGGFKSPAMYRMRIGRQRNYR